MARVKIKKASLWMGGVVVCRIVAVAAKVHEADLIIGLHYAAYKWLIWTINIISAFMLVFAIFNLLMAILLKSRNHKIERKEAEVQQEKARHQAKESRLQTPDSVYRYLVDLHRECKEGSAMRGRLDSLLRQLEHMNEIQARAKRLFTVNGIKNLSEAETLLQDVEDVICLQNVKGLINHYIAGGDEAFLARVDKVLDSNSVLLEQANGTLGDLVDYINGGTDKAGVLATIAAFRAVIQQCTEEDFDEKLDENPGTVAVSGNNF